MRHSTLYIVLFASAICVVCGVLVSGAAVSMADRQRVNQALDRQQKVLEAAGLVETGVKLLPEQIAEHFEEIDVYALDLRSGDIDPDFDVADYDYRAAARDPQLSRPAPPNQAGIARLPEKVPVYFVRSGGELEMVVLPIHGLGLWGTLYGFLALDADTTTVRGITYYEHKETPGLGGEVDNPNWKALWPGRKVFDESGRIRIEVIKGSAGPVSEDPYRVDGLSGATITSRGVTNMLHFWLSDDVYGPFLEKVRSGALDELSPTQDGPEPTATSPEA